MLRETCHERDRTIKELKVYLGSLVQARREHLKLTQAQVAEAAGLSLKYYGEVERGEANATFEAMGSIAWALQWNPWSLFSDKLPVPMAQPVHTLMEAELRAALQVLAHLLDLVHALHPRVRLVVSETSAEPTLRECLTNACGSLDGLAEITALNRAKRGRPTKHRPKNAAGSVTTRQFERRRPLVVGILPTTWSSTLRKEEGVQGPTNRPAPRDVGNGARSSGRDLANEP